MKHKYEGLVGNIGWVYQGGTKEHALEDFKEYVA